MHVARTRVMDTVEGEEGLLGLPCGFMVEPCVVEGEGGADGAACRVVERVAETCGHCGAVLNLHCVVEPGGMGWKCVFCDHVNDR